MGGSVVDMVDGVDAERQRSYAWTYLSYMMIFMIRKSLSTLKPTIMSEFDFTPGMMSSVDTAFLFPYTFCGLISGRLVDIVGPAVMLTIALLGCSISTVVFCTGHTLSLFRNTWFFC